jgi:hypothetical protein
MAPGSLLLASLLLTAGQLPSDVAAFNHRNLRVPIGIHPAKRAEISQLLLFVSSDQGKTWHQEAVVPPENDEFLFYAPSDGMYWLRVAVVNKQGKQEPEDMSKGPPDQKVLIDTLKPMVRIASAQRQGDEVVVAWEIQEEYPDMGSLKLEYQPADGSSLPWASMNMPQALVGQARFRSSTSSPLVVRVHMKDQAGNVSYSQAEVPGASGIIRASANANAIDTAPAPAPLTAPPAEVKSVPPREVKAPAAPRPPEPAPDLGATINSGGYVPPPPPRGIPAAPVTPAPESTGKVVARSDEARPQVTAQPPPAIAASTPVPSATGEPGRAGLPAVRLVNNPEVVLEYQVDKVGPAGIGCVELWLTQTDGQTWQRWAEDPEAKTLTSGGKVQRTVELPGEGVYGFRLVVKSRAGRGRAAPTPGDLPEMRIEVDTTAPVAQLFEPRPDPQHRDALQIRWSATDRNLAAAPITLEWAERADGEWHRIVANHPNSPEGYSWQVPHDVPVSVYLRLRVKDAAGNEGVAVTGEPQLVDLSEPEGHLLNVSLTPHR